MKVGFIGAGFITRFQAIAIHQVRGLEITGVLKRNGSDAFAAFCRDNRLNEARIYDSIAELANQVDALALYVPNDRRLEVMEQVVAAVQAGARVKGVIVDKSLGAT